MAIEINAETVTVETLDRWATDPGGPVALHLKQQLLPVEGAGGVIFPPTYADIGYNVDTLADGTRVATIDSVGSQANRLEPIFKASADDRANWLVPQIEILLREEPCGACDACKRAGGTATSEAEVTGPPASKLGEPGKKSRGGTTGGSAAACKQPHKIKRSILDLAHRAADAVVRSSPSLSKLIEPAFRALQRTGDAGPLCELVPTSLVFGVWDSRGIGEKRPRLVRSVIRAWDVAELHAAAQFNSLWKSLDENERKELEAEAKGKRVKLSAYGLKDAPSVFRKVGQRAAKAMPTFREGKPNEERRVLGGVLARGPIEREITVNLVALRGLRGKDKLESDAIRKYVLGLALVAATADIDLYLREGCFLRYADADGWRMVPRRGEPAAIALTVEGALQYARTCANYFRPRWTSPVEHKLDLKEAKKLLATKAEDDEGADDE